MRRAICAVYEESREHCLCNRKHNPIPKCCFEHVSQRYTEVQYTSV